MDYGKSGSRDERGPSAGKIFVGGLSWETTTENLTTHFKKYGEIVDSVVMRNRNTQQPRGFGFVTYADPSVIDKVLKDTHLIDGRTVEIKRSIPRESMVKGPRTKKIFVGGLLPSVTESELKRYFSQFGTVVEAQIMLEHGTGRPRGFGFITFDDEQAVDDLMSQDKTFELGGKQVEIKKAEPKKASDEPDHGYRSRIGRGGYEQSGYDSYDDMHGSRLGYVGRDPGMRSRGYGDGPGAYGGHGYGSGFGGYGGGGGYGGYGGSMLGQFEGDTYGGMGYNYYGGGYGGSSYSYGGNSYGSPGAYGGGYGPSSSYGNDYGYGRSSGRYHPYGRN